jgi:succinate dehydrogenase (ubiquinone) cytochrome b560 subunit
VRHPYVWSHKDTLEADAEFRTVKTQSLSPEASQEILNAQRLKRPSSPHFTIYQPQLTWLASIVHRGTGTGLSVCA